MTDIALVTANRVSIVGIPIEQATLPAAEAITAGQVVRIDTTAGTFTLANGTDASEARAWGVATKTVASGMPVTAIKRGRMDGFALAALDYDAAIYLSNTDGTLADGAGSVSKIVGRVFPVFSTTLGTSPDKILEVDL